MRSLAMVRRRVEVLDDVEADGITVTPGEVLEAVHGAMRALAHAIGEAIGDEDGRGGRRGQQMGRADPPLFGRVDLEVYAAARPLRLVAQGRLDRQQVAGCAVFEGGDGGFASFPAGGVR